MTECVARVAGGVADIPRDQWDACAGTANPFIRWDFLSALEKSGSVGPGTGWQPLPLLIDGVDGRIAAAAPLYAKTHSQGEYVFDHGWADAWERAGGSYYPKIQLASPFTPVPGPRLLLRDPALGPALIAGIEAVVERNDLSSAHATFVEPDQAALFESAGWLIREDSQFHWTNRGYRDFGDFLDSLSSAKRKNIRKERARAVEGLEIVHMTGGDLTETHWDAFWRFYQDTGSRKWGRPYLTRTFFSMLGESMAESVLLVLA
ncbi:MAG TPA: peptidogalycan biosysnthesis protein, partial [Sphingobium sp.]